MAVRSSQEDFLLRELRKVAAMIARALGFRAQGDLPAARAEIDTAYATLLGPQSALLRMLDPPSAARLIGNSKKLAALARLTSTEAALADENGNHEAERRLATRARSFAEEAVKMDPRDDDAMEILRDLRAH
ncbi:MAG TPA: hypothetical protein VGJ64_02510 [Gemmatimonadaceae bacterium]